MILSVSRRTDIPAFYADWFFNRINEGFVCVRNPFNANSVSRISLSPDVIDCLVFWTKYPSPSFFRNLDKLSQYNYYFQFTVNPYDNSIEKNVPSKEHILDVFRQLSARLGKNRIIWRYDPILISDAYTVDYHIQRFGKLMAELSPFTGKCIISFLDLYRKCEANLANISVREPGPGEVYQLAAKFSEMANAHGIKLETCAEKYDLSSYSIVHAKCIDSELIERISGKKLKSAKDKNQREHCGCIESIDIGEYNTCRHDCLYCYANSNNEKARKNMESHSPRSPLLIGDIKSTDRVTERKMFSLSIPKTGD